MKYLKKDFHICLLRRRCGGGLSASRPLLSPRLRAGDASERAATVREASMPQLPRYTGHRALWQAPGSAPSAAQKAHGQHEGTHLRLRGGERRGGGSELKGKIKFWGHFPSATSRTTRRMTFQRGPVLFSFFLHYFPSREKGEKKITSSYDIG